MGSFSELNHLGYNGLEDIWICDLDVLSYFGVVGGLKEMVYCDLESLWFYDLMDVNELIRLNSELCTKRMKYIAYNDGKSNLYVLHTLPKPIVKDYPSLEFFNQDPDPVRKWAPIIWWTKKVAQTKKEVVTMGTMDPILRWIKRVGHVMLLVGPFMRWIWKMALLMTLCLKLKVWLISTVRIWAKHLIGMKVRMWVQQKEERWLVKMIVLFELLLMTHKKKKLG